MNWELFSFIRKALPSVFFCFLCVWYCRQVEVVCDTTQEISFNGPEERFMYDVIICEDLYIITIHLKIWDEPISVPFDVMLQPWVLLYVISFVNEAVSKKNGIRKWSCESTGFWPRMKQWNKVGRFFFLFFFVPESGMMKYLPADATLVRRIRISTKSTARLALQKLIYQQSWLLSEQMSREKKRP